MEMKIKKKNLKFSSTLLLFIVVGGGGVVIVVVVEVEATNHRECHPPCLQGRQPPFFIIEGLQHEEQMGVEEVDAVGAVAPHRNVFPKKVSKSQQKWRHPFPTCCC